MSKPLESWRIFVALELPESLRQKITRHMDRLREQLPEVRASWTRAQNLHLTLKFLGDTPVARVEAVAAALSGAANSCGPFEIAVGDCGAFPPRGKPNVLWIGIDDPSGKLHKLQAALETECADAGFQRDQRTFHPHLTIARLRHPSDARGLAEVHRRLGFESTAVRVTDACLIRSELSSAGSRYTILARHELAA